MRREIGKKERVGEKEEYEKNQLYGRRRERGRKREKERKREKDKREERERKNVCQAHSLECLACDQTISNERKDGVEVVVLHTQTRGVDVMAAAA